MSLLQRERIAENVETGYVKNKLKKYANKAMAKAEKMARKKLGDDKVDELKKSMQSEAASDGAAETPDKTSENLRM